MRTVLHTARQMSASPEATNRGRQKAAAGACGCRWRRSYTESIHPVVEPYWQVVVHPIARGFTPGALEKLERRWGLAQAWTQPATHWFAAGAPNLIERSFNQLALSIRLHTRKRLRVRNAVTHQLPVAPQTGVDDSGIVTTHRGIERDCPTDAKLIQDLHDAPDANTVSVDRPWPGGRLRIGCTSSQDGIDHHLSTRPIQLDDLTLGSAPPLRDDDHRRARRAPTDGENGPSPLFTRPD